MNDVIFGQVIQRYEYLNSEPFDEIEREALEVVHFDEFVQVYGQHFERYHKMLSEVELVQAANNVLFVLRILVVQVLYQFRFHQALLVQPLFVFQDL